MAKQMHGATLKYPYNQGQDKCIFPHVLISERNQEGLQIGIPFSIIFTS
jgi:hypothetical protein